MNNPLGIISMQFVRPVTTGDLGLFGTIKALGFDFVELLMPEPEDGLDLGEVRRALEENELGVVLAARVSPARSLASSDDAARKGGLDYLRACIETASRLGAGIVGGPLYGGPLVFAGIKPAPIAEAERLARFERCIEGLAHAAKAAADAGVGLALEPLNRFETDSGSTVAQGIELVDAVGSPALGLLLDSFHMNIEEPALGAAIRLAGARLRHFQANENHRGCPGTGQMPWSEVFRALHEVGYDGPVSLEPFRREDERFGVPLAQWRPPDTAERVKLQRSVAYMRSLLAMAEHRV
jgi:D-psicose/D-tagatose/L-ribulose 3-epimerase